MGLLIVQDAYRQGVAISPLLGNEKPASALSVLLLIMALTLSEVVVICLCKLMAVYAEYSFYARFSSMEDLALMANVRDNDGREHRRSQTVHSEEERSKEIEVAMITRYYSSTSPSKDHSLPTVANGTQPEKNASRELDADSCPVCLLEFEAGDSISMSRNCTHKFHNKCIFEWLRRQDTCPLCRQDVFRPMSKCKNDEPLSSSENDRRQFDTNRDDADVHERNLGLHWLRSGRTLDPELWTFLF